MILEVGALYAGVSSAMSIASFLHEAGKELKNDTGKVLRTYLSTFDEVIADKWRDNTNPLKDSHGFDELEVHPNLFADYDIRNPHGRSFVYDLLNAVVIAMNEKSPDIKRQSLIFTRKLADDWKYLLELNLINLNLPAGYHESIIHEFEWARYKLWLCTLPIEPIKWIDFIVEGGISSIYIEPFATERNNEEKQTELDEPGEDLENHVMNARCHGNKSEPILIMGRPGMGKTSFSKVFIARLIESEPDIYPVFVRLRVLKQFMEGKTWIAALKEAPHVQDDSEPLILSDNDLAKKNILLVLDGLDEVAIGGAGQNDLNSFFTGVNQTCNHANIQVVITSRPLTFLHDHERLENTSSIFDIKPLDVGMQDTLIINLKNSGILTADNYEFKKKLSVIDRHNKKHHEKMAGQPLLLFMLADAYSNMNDEERSSLTDDCSLGKIYDIIITNTLNREYDRGFEHCKMLGVDKARKILGDTALALYQMYTDYARPDDIKGFLKEYETKDGMVKLKSVFVAFHMIEKDSGVEFFHKSIAEYLTAEAITDRLQDACDVYYFKDKRNDDDFARNLISIFGPREINDDLAIYLVDIFRNRTELCKLLPVPLQIFINDVLSKKWLNDGITFIISKNHPAHIASGCVHIGDPLGYETRAGFSSIRMFSVIQSAHPIEPPLEVYLRKESCVNDDSLRLFMNRRPERKPLRLIVSPAIANLEHAELDLVSLYSAMLSGAKLSGAYLSGADLRKADLSAADLTNTDLDGAYLEGAFLEDASTSKAKLWGANLTGAILKGPIPDDIIRDAN